MKSRKQVILVVALILILINLANLIVFNYSSNTLPTGGATTAQGTTSLCINNPPSITPLSSQTATVGVVFSLSVSASDDGTLTYYDDSALFNINSSTGTISFTPAAGEVGTSSITITVEDDSTCTRFNSTASFSLIISAAAEPSPTGATGGGGGGGGGGGAGAKPALKNVSFEISEEVLKVALKQSRSLERTITLINYGEVELFIEIENPLEEVVYLSPASFIVGPGQKQNIQFLFNPNLNAQPNIYSGLALIEATYSSTRLEKEVVIVLEVESDEVLVDASLDLAKKTLLPGEELKGTISIFNLRRAVEASVTLLYAITDLENKIIYEDKETLILRDQASFLKTVPLTGDLKPGEYVFSVKVVHEESFASATEIFTIAEKKEPASIQKSLNILNFAVIGGIVIALGAVFVILLLLHKKIRKPKTIIQNNTVRKTVNRVIVKTDPTNLRRKLSALKESYERGFIQEKTFRQAEQKLMQLIKENRTQ
ncbi:MAG TPA: Ig domain-containing protein [Candidatus Nanoarchaeia archaeon]|nr:Ig domain-containing protein [Candidatus Nanoarchaeia archaeon]